MSNQLFVEVVRTVDPYSTDNEGEVIWIAYDGYGKTFASYGDKDIADFIERFPTVYDLLSEVFAMDGMDGLGIVTEDNEILLDTCTSIEVHGYFPDGEVFVETA